MIRTQCVAICALMTILTMSHCYAGEVVGMVKTSLGEVSLERQGQKLPAIIGTQIEVADRLRTGANAAVGITLRDSTLLSAGPNSVLVIDRFAYDTTTQAGAMSIGVRKGTLSVASGKIAKKTPESVDFHTPTSVLGVRGTEFVIEVAGGRDE